MKLHYSKNVPEIVLAFYFSMFSILKPFTISHINYSKLILAIVVWACIMIYFMDNIFLKKGFRLYQFVISTFIPILFLAFDFIIRNNSRLGDNMYFYLLYGVIPILFSVQVNDYEKLLKYISIISFIVGIIYLIDPFNGYKWSGDYMYLGYNVMLPAFAGGVILLYKYNKKIVIPFIFIISLEIAIYTNKGATLAAAVIFFVLYIVLANKSRDTFKRLILVMILTGIVFILREQIFNFLINISGKLGVSSYSLQSAKMLLSENSFFDSRTDIWHDAIRLIKESIFWGYGIGYFQATTGGYVHNLFLDILLSSGIVVFTIFVGVFVFAIKKIIHMKNVDKSQLLIFLILLWFIPLQISLNLWAVMPFWLFWAILFRRETKK